MLSNAEVAKKLLEIRTLMELAGESFYKYSAFEKAATTVENAAPLPDVIAAGELLKLPGIGKSIGAVVEQLVTTGTAEALDALFARYPPSILEVLAVSGIGTKTTATLFAEYGIASLADLEAAIDSGALAGAPRLGPKTLENWKRGILAYKGRQHRTPLPRALAIAREAMAFLSEGPPLHRLTFAGSLRRQEVTVGDIDLICTSDNAAEVTAYFANWERAEAVLAEGPTKSSIWLPGGLQIDLRVLPDHLYGNLLQHFTGSREHNIKLREHAVRKNLRVSENGILDLETGDVTTCAEESEVYAKLGMQYIPPELRQGLDEIDLARNGTIPNLVELGDLRGDFHMHSTWSDGEDSLEEMIAAAAARGLRISRDQRSLAGAGFDVRPLCRKAARAARDGCRAREKVRHSHALRERSRYSSRRLARFPGRRSGRVGLCDRVGALGVPANARRDDRALDSRVRKPVRQRHRPPDGARTRELRVRLRRRLCRGGANRNRDGDRRTEDPAGSARAAGPAREEVSA